MLTYELDLKETISVNLFFVGFIPVHPKNLNNSVFMTDAEAVRAPWCSIPFCYSWTGNLTWVQREVTDMGTTVLELSQLLYDVS